MSGLTVLGRIVSQRFKPVIINRLVSTSSKKNEATSGSAVPSTSSKPESEKNWISYGYDKNDKASDRNAMHSSMFGTITICIVFGGFVLAYLPDYNLRDWSVREAFLELKRREQNGLPLVDPNLIDPSKINLPSDEELGDMEIII